MNLSARETARADSTAQQVASDNAQDLMIQGAGSIEQSVEVSAETLGATPTKELWVAWFASLQAGWVESKGVAEKTAEKYATDTKALLKEKYAMTKPQSEGAKAIAEKRAEQDKAFAHLSNAELVESIAVSTDKKASQALIKSDNSIEVQVSRAEKVMAFITNS